VSESGRRRAFLLAAATLAVVALVITLGEARHATPRETAPGSATGVADRRAQQRAADARVGGLLEASADARVRRYLADPPPRTVGRPERPRVASVHLYRARAGGAKASALLEYGRARSLFEFLLRRRGRSWRVSELYP
jgi:hypothetical protein